MKKYLFKPTALFLVFILVLSGCKKSSGNLTRGEWNKKTYTNSYFDIEYKLPDIGSYYDDEALSRLAGYDVAKTDVNKPDRVTLAYIDALVFYVEISAQKNPKGNSEQKTLENIMSELEKDDSFSRPDKETTDKKIGKNNFKTACGRYIYPGAEGEEDTVAEVCASVRSVGDYMLIITVTSYDGTDFNLIIKDFN